MHQGTDVVLGGRCEAEPEGRMEMVVETAAEGDAVIAGGLGATRAAYLQRRPMALRYLAIARGEAL